MQVTDAMIGVVYWVHTDWKLLSDTAFPDLLTCPIGDLDRGDPKQEKIASQREKLEYDIELLRAMGIRRMRTNISWAEAWTPNGAFYQDWYLRKLAAHFQLLPCINYTPPRITLTDQTNAPPRNLNALGAFVRQVFGERLPGLFSSVQLWNEPNLNTDWNPTLDPDLRKLAAMLSNAARICQQEFGLQTVMGGMNKLDLEWFGQFILAGGVDYFDAIGFNSLRGTWSEKRLPIPWNEKLAKVQEFAFKQTGRIIPSVMTEIGYPTIDFRQRALSPEMIEQIQTAIFAETVRRSRESGFPAYWYTLTDMPYSIRSVRAVTTGWEDILQHHFGCFLYTGVPKLLGRLLLAGGVKNVESYADDNDLRGLASVVIDRGEPR